MKIRDIYFLLMGVLFSSIAILGVLFPRGEIQYGIIIFCIILGFIGIFVGIDFRKNNLTGMSKGLIVLKLILFIPSFFILLIFLLLKPNDSPYDNIREIIEGYWGDW